MSTSDSIGAQGRSPFTRPGFIAATALVVVIAVVAAALALANTMSSRQDTATAEESASTEAAGPVEIPPPSTAGPDHDGTQSVCGLEGEVTGTADLVEAPEVDSWEYQGTTAYPVSAEYGPAATDPDGFRYCFQHSPEGALYAAANAVATATDQSLVPTWIEYFASRGANRDDLLSDGDGSNSTSSDEGTRLNITGFRLLACNGDTARVDLAVHGSTPSGTVILSMVYELVWQDGDWKLNTDSETPVDVAPIPDISGYVEFGE